MTKCPQETGDQPCYNFKQLISDNKPVTRNCKTCGRNGWFCTNCDAWHLEGGWEKCGSKGTDSGGELPEME